MGPEAWATHLSNPLVITALLLLTLSIATKLAGRARPPAFQRVVDGALLLSVVVAIAAIGVVMRTHFDQPVRATAEQPPAVIKQEASAPLAIIEQPPEPAIAPQPPPAPAPPVEKVEPKKVPGPAPKVTAAARSQDEPAASNPSVVQFSTGNQSPPINGRDIQINFNTQVDAD